MTLFTELSILIALAAFFALVAHRLKQPLILGYIAAGLLLNYFGLLHELRGEGLELFSKIGIVFLLFILGIELDIRELRKLGMVAFATGIGQIIFTTIIGIGISIALGFTLVPSIIVALALTFSSTIVVVKLLTQKKQIDTLHGKIAIGFLLVQDIVAIAILIILSSSLTLGNVTSDMVLIELLLLVAKVMVAVSLLVLITRFLLPLLIRFTGHDRELLFLVSISWALLFAAIIGNPPIALSAEIGALAAGIALSARKESLQIESWTRPLRDFFITVFFVLLGFNVQLGDVSELVLPIALFSLFVIIGNPVIVMIIMGLFGYSSKTSFMAGLAVAQISEFSLLLANLGLQTGQITSKEVTMLTIIGGITMTASGYMIYYNEELYSFLKRPLKFFEFRYNPKLEKRLRNTKGKIIVFGFHRIGLGLSDLIADGDKKFIIVDNNPEALKRAEAAGAQTVFGDMSDSDLLKNLNLEHAAAIVSTVPDKNANLQLLLYTKQNEIQAPIILPAANDEVALEFYELGADLVLYPHLFTRQRLVGILERDDLLAALNNFSTREKKALLKTKLTEN